MRICPFKLRSVHHFHSFLKTFQKMCEVVDVEITTNVSDMPLEKKYPLNMTVRDLKKKLELVVGTEAENIKLEHFDSNGISKGDISEDGKTLKDFRLVDGSRIHAIDKSGGNVELQDGSMVEKYEISDRDYESRDETFRAWKKKMEQEQGLKFQKNEQPSQKNEEAAKNMKIGDRCEVRISSQPPRRGEVAFIGNTSFKDGIWVGVKYDEPVGKNNGSVAGVRYFECEDKYGGFVRPVDVFVGDYPEIDEI